MTVLNMTKHKKTKGFTLVEMLFWLAMIALIVGGFIYKNTKQIQKAPANSGQGGVFGDLKSETDRKQNLVEEN